MLRDEHLLIIRDTPAAILDALDGLLGAQGWRCLGIREVREDWTPLLVGQPGVIVFVLSRPRQEWTACFSSLAPAAEWELAEALAGLLEQPLVYTVINDHTALYAYRYFAAGLLREEAPLADAGAAALDWPTFQARLAAHGVPLALLDDRRLDFGAPHLVAAYEGVRSAA
ncbi:hypothetical protein [Kallotenue papyrolyticum]|uniref:hypothetical protein n=1 Tax=Kallotenue papyrolyticum TaxID=1325125 RepID=UPI0004786147|nr:hypothetical protein [Kallotenue papyrolyticum]